MKDNYKNNLWSKKLQSLSFVNRPVLFFVFLFFMFSSGMLGQNPKLIEPSFEHIDSKDRGNASVGTEANINVAVDTDSEGNVYILTFGSGVFKYDPKNDTFTKIITDVLGENGNLNSPLDLAVSNDDVIYIADGGSKLIKKFSTSGDFINSIGSGSGGNGKDELWEPTGIEFDSDNNLYIVDAYRGDNTEITQKYFLKIYYSDGRFKSFQGTSDHPIINPYRVAANDKYIFVSHSSNNGEVLVFNKDFTYKTTLSNLGSPGSLFVDDFGFLYVADYSNRLNFGQIFKIIKGNGSIPEYFNIYNQIQQGINESEFTIQIFDANLNQIPGISEIKNPAPGKDFIQLPLDLTLDHCNKLYLDDANISAFITLNFDLEIYQRTPSFDTEKPVIVCPSDITREVDAGKNYATVNFNTPTATDNCSTPTVIQTKGPAAGSQFLAGTTTEIEFTATDSARNEFACSFTITVLPADNTTDSEAPVITCPSTIIKNNDPGKCGSIVTFQPPTVSDNSGESITAIRTDSSPLNSGDLFPIGTTTLTYSAKDSADNSSVCDLVIIISDNEKPIFECPENITASFEISKGYTIPDYSSFLPATDNCDTNLSYTQTPAVGSKITAGGDYDIELTAVDNSENIGVCKFVLKLTEVDSFYISCNSRVAVEPIENCKYVMPDLSAEYLVFPTDAEVSQSILPETIITESQFVTLTATYGSVTKSCDIKIDLVDYEYPVISDCPRRVNITLGAGETFTIPDYTTIASATDNCSIRSFTQDISEGTEITNNTTIKLTAIDTYGNDSYCFIEIVVTSSNPDLEIACPGNQTENLDANCQFQLPDYTQQAQANFDGTITQLPLPGTVINSDTDVTLTAKGEEGVTTCTFKVKVADITPPLANCIASFDLRLNANGQASLNADSLDNNSYDACGITSKSLSQTTFTADDLGENIVVLTVTDAGGNSDSCETKVNVLPFDENAPDFTCKESIIVQLDENGQVQITPEDLYTGNGADYQFTLDRSTFTCDDKGSNDVLLYYTNGNDSGSCTIEVIVEDLIGPSVRTQDIRITLDANGRASISPEMLDNGSTDNCGEVYLFLDKTDFTCDDLGENRILLRAQDNSSNLGSAYAVITVLGDCELPPTNPSGPDYIFIYPNPTDGPFTYYLPEGVVLNKVEVYDMQGKYIMTQEFQEATVKHEMDLTGLQNAVYVLNLFTSEGTKILRVIVY